MHSPAGILRPGRLGAARRPLPKEGLELVLDLRGGDGALLMLLLLAQRLQLLPLPQLLQLLLPLPELLEVLPQLLLVLLGEVLLLLLEVLQQDLVLKLVLLLDLQDLLLELALGRLSLLGHPLGTVHDTVTTRHALTTAATTAQQLSELIRQLCVRSFRSHWLER